MKLIRITRTFLAGVLLAFAAILALNSQARADTLLFDNGPGNFTSSRGIGDSPLARITVSAPTSISQIGVLTDLGTSGNIKFLIFDSGTHALLFQSGAQFFADNGLTFKVSNSFTPFILMPGTVYNIGGIADVTGAWATWNGAHSFTQNGITSSNPNQNVANFANPTLVGEGGADIVIQLYGPNVAAVPEPATLVLLGTGLAGAVGAIRKRRRL